MAYATIAIIGCLDTKGHEVLFLKQVIEESGNHVHVIDTGVAGEPVFAAETTADEVARAAGSSLAELRRRGDRGEAIALMSEGAACLVRRLHERGAIQGVLAAGGSANTTIATTAMRALPAGFPKVMVSTLASGDVSPYVDTRDITMMYSIVDIAGINRLSARILANAARAVAAMAAAPERAPEASRPLIAATMFGVTTPCVTRARQILEEAGYEVLVFHATGTGGRAMEGLIEDGFIAGVLDITTTELADELAGGVLSAGPRRLTVAGAAGIPQVVSVGAVDMVNFGPRATVPEKHAGRKLYQHNPTVTLMRTTPEENAEIGRRIAARLNGSRGAVKVLLPLRGVSLYARAGGPFHDPEADRRCLEAIRENLDRRHQIEEIDADINDERFARAAAESLLALLRGPGSTRKELT
jgi:uncharacterized protein (UPF0261 family)